MKGNQESLLGATGRLVELIGKIVLVYVYACINLFRKPKRKDIAGQNVLITGSGHGLGRDLAKKFVREGANVIMVDINKFNNEQVKGELLGSCSKMNTKVLAYTVDIRDERQVAELAAKVRNDVGPVDILVNNAGIVQCKNFLNLSPELIEKTFQVNALAHFWTIKHFLPEMIERKRGHIVAIASIAGVIGTRYLTDYCASKFAVVGMMEALEKEVHEGGANKGIRFTTVCPASMTTGMFQTLTSRFSWLMPILNADHVADETMDAVLTNKPFVTVPPVMFYLYQLSKIIPLKAGRLIQDYLDYGVRPHSD